MRFTPASMALATILALSASSVVGQKLDDEPSGGVAAAKPWMTRGAAAMHAGDLAAARSDYETALLLAPGDPDIYFALGQVARAQKLPGKAIKYFSDVLRLDPKNQLALQGEGLAMVERGATESAKGALAKLNALCKTSCAAAEPLVAAIAAGPPKYVAADAGPSDKSGPLEHP